MASSQPTIGGPDTSGATVQPQYMGRTMKCYPVQETEIEMLAVLNTQATLFFAAATGAAGYAFSIWTNAQFVEKLTPTAKVASDGLMPVLIAVAVIFGAIGVYSAFRRGGLWDKIKKESFIVQATMAAPAVTTADLLS
jgi:hypothetical protein